MKTENCGIGFHKFNSLFLYPYHKSCKFKSTTLSRSIVGGECGRCGYEVDIPKKIKVILALDSLNK